MLQLVAAASSTSCRCAGPPGRWFLAMLVARVVLISGWILASASALWPGRSGEPSLTMITSNGTAMALADYQRLHRHPFGGAFVAVDGKANGYGLTVHLLKALPSSAGSARAVAAQTVICIPTRSVGLRTRAGSALTTLGRDDRPLVAKPSPPACQ